MRQLPRPADRLADPPHALGVAVDDADGAELVQRALGGHRGRVDPLPGGVDVLADVRRPPVHGQDHRQVLGRGGPAVGDGGSGRGAHHVRLAGDPDQVGDVAAAGPLHVVGVDRPAADGLDGVLELARLVQAVGVQAHRHVMGVREPQRRVDDLRVRAPVLVDLQPAGAGLQHPLDLARDLGARAGLQAQVDREELERPQGLVHDVRRFLEPGVMIAVIPADRATGTSPRRYEVHVAVIPASGGDSP